MAALFTLTLGLSAFLLFLVEPMFAKMILPHVGGAPAVWNTCLVFFQVALLGGYLYAHASTRWLGARGQVALQVLLLLVPLVVLPVAIPVDWRPANAGRPIPALLLELVLTVGLPFLAVSTTAPLLQHWFSRTSHAHAADPYFLYAASNVGSLAALVLYPLVVEPRLRLAEQSRLWAVGYVVLAGLTCVCAAAGWRRGMRLTPAGLASDPRGVAHPLKAARLVRWVVLAAVPSSLLLSVTTTITVDVASVPLLWTVPLGLYLLSFVVVFGRRRFLTQDRLAIAFPLLVLAPIVGVALDWHSLRSIPLHLFGLLVVSLYCHGELANDRPPAEHLTAFYLSMSAGGAIGGLFNVLAAPLLFSTTLEYPLGIVAACLLVRSRTYDTRSVGWRRVLDIVVPVSAGGLVLLLRESISGLDLPPVSLAGTAHVFALPAALCLGAWRRPVRFAAAAAAIIGAAALVPQGGETERFVARSFYGVHRVMDRGGYRLLAHGTTTHGLQSLNPARVCDPLSYYARTGPVGQIFAASAGAHARRRIGIVGLGAGTLAAYATPGQRWTFFDINPVVERIARDPALFRYLSDCGANPDVVLGDARLSLQNASDGEFDLLLFDAFSSDAIPIHLITRDAIRMYTRKLAPGGVLIFHTSNRYLDLEPVLGSVASDLGMTGRYDNEDVITARESAAGKMPSEWAILARGDGDLGDLAADSRWVRLERGRPSTLWSDDYSNIVSILRW